MSSDVLMRELDADRRRVRNLGDPGGARDATFTDNETSPRPVGGVAVGAGKSLLAAPADHEHRSLAPMRIAAWGTATVAPGARVTLATIKRSKGEVFLTGGFGFVRDDDDGVTWEGEVGGADDIALYHERTGTKDELRFRIANTSDKTRTVEWATVALTAAAST